MKWGALPLTFPLKTKIAEKTSQTIENLLYHLPQDALKTITFNNNF